MESVNRCRICRVKEAKNTCPRCLIETCSLECSVNHETQFDCRALKQKRVRKSVQEYLDEEFGSGTIILSMQFYNRKYLVDNGLAWESDTDSDVEGEGQRYEQKGNKYEKEGKNNGDDNANPNEVVKGDVSNIAAAIETLSVEADPVGSDTDTDPLSDFE